MKKLKVNRSVYSDKSIHETMKVYKNYALMTVKYKEEYAIITFWKCLLDETQTVKEFENYMIGVENS